MCVYDMYICIQHPSPRQDMFAKVGLEGQMVPWQPNCSDFSGDKW